MTNNTKSTEQQGSEDTGDKVPKERFEGGRDQWKADEVAREASQIDEDEIQRQISRADETKGDPNARDYAGSAASEDTPQGREEAKNDLKGKANTNG